jgi:peptide/nickel transport system substrate-binding protein
MKRLLWFTLLIATVIIMIVSGCSNSTTTTSTTSSQPAATTSSSTAATSTTTTTQVTKTATVKSGGVLRIIVSEGPTNSIGVPANWRGQTFNEIRACIQPLVGVNQNGEFVGILATDWKLASDLTYIDFNLRKGVKFHDSSDFNATVAKWNLDYNIKVPVGGTDKWSSVEVLSDYAIRLRLKKFDNTIFQDLSSVPGMMISQVAMEKNGAAGCDWNPAGTGPFKYKSYKENDYLEFSRFDDYWGGKAYLDGVKYLVIADGVTAQLALEAGNAEAIYLIGRWSDTAHELVPKGYKAEGGAYGMRGLVPDSATVGSPLANLKVRQALEYAINRPKIATATGFGYWTPLEQCACGHQTGFIQGYQGRSYNPDTAKQLLTEAGYPSGFATTIYSGVHLNGKEMEAIQADLKAVNIDAKIEVISIAKWIEAQAIGWTGGYFSAGLQAMKEEANYGVWLRRYWTGENGYFPTTARSDALKAAMAKALVEPDTAKQITLYQECNRIMTQDALFIPLWYDSELYTMKSYVMDMGVSGWTDPAYRGFGRTWLDQ